MDDFDQIWADVAPVPQDDATEAVVAIAYAPTYNKIMSIFRAVLRSGEKSQRVIDLTELILDENAANYTVWQYRRQCLCAIGANLDQELDFVDQFSDDNPKNYQIWYHRRAIVDTSRNASREISFCDRVLSADAKNYHCWAHRQYIVKKYGLWDGELDRVESLLTSDARNNSAWNHRWFVLTQGPGAISAAVLDREVKYTHSHVQDVQYNESAWNYLRGLVEAYPTLDAPIKTICIDVLKGDTTKSDRKDGSKVQESIDLGFVVANPNCFAMSLLADRWANDHAPDKSEKLKARILYKKLMVIDSLRVKAWKWKLEKLDLLL